MRGIACLSAPCVITADCMQYTCGTNAQMEMSGTWLQILRLRLDNMMIRPLTELFVSYISQSLVLLFSLPACSTGISC